MANLRDAQGGGGRPLPFPRTRKAAKVVTVATAAAAGIGTAAALVDEYGASTLPEPSPLPSPGPRGVDSLYDQGMTRREGVDPTLMGLPPTAGPGGAVGRLTLSLAIKAALPGELGEVVANDYERGLTEGAAAMRAALEDENFFGNKTGSDIDPVLRRGRGFGDVGGERHAVTTSSVLADLYQMDEEELARTQMALYANGFYGSTPLDAIEFGTADEVTAGAWAIAVNRAAAYHAADEDTTLEQVLSVSAAEAQAVRDGTVGGPPAPIPLSDPAGLAATTNDIATQVLGRRATREEQRLIVGIVHQMQRDAQRATTGEVAMPDIQAQAEAQLRTGAPKEAEATDLMGQYGAFLSFMSSPQAGG